jgi:hypothetical protein
MKKYIIYLILLWNFQLQAQEDTFDYTIEINPISIPGLPGLHSFAFAQHDNYWLIIGGRTDGLHARQANRSFPADANNTEMYVVDINTRKVWSRSLDNLPVSLQEQLQATNMNFIQDGETLYFIGGYAFAPSVQNHITFPYLTAIHVPKLIEAIIQQETGINNYFVQLEDQRFAVTGGQMGKIGNTFYLIGGHRFDGRYNPMGNPTFTQAYTNQIKKFKTTLISDSLIIEDYESLTDPVHLRRRDYNLVPQVFGSGELGYMISSGVFQLNADLPFLYPVDIRASGYEPRTEFNQYLSNYHGAKVALYDAENQQNHALFFGGISQYYYENGSLIKDDLVPFTKTISRVTRYANDTLREFLVPIEMPGLLGASSEFIVNKSLPAYSNKVIKLHELKEDSFIVGHIVGGLSSPIKNPFSSNQTTLTSAEPTIYEVVLKKSVITSIPPVDGRNPFDITIYPNPFHNSFTVSVFLEKATKTDLFITNAHGQLIQKENLSTQIGANNLPIVLEQKETTNPLFVTLVFDDKFYVSKKLVKAR